MKTRIAVLFAYLFISFAVCIGLLIHFSIRLNYLIENGTSFNYTTCIITKIRSYKTTGKSKVPMREITFIYNADDANPWSERGTYTNKKQDMHWSDTYKPGDIGTCVHSSFLSTTNSPKKYHETFTLDNFVKHQDTSAMWLIVDGKAAEVCAIVYFALLLLFLCGAACVGAASEDDDSDTAFGLGCGAWILAGMLVGVPLTIMGSVMEAGLNGPLGKEIAVHDVYEDVDGGCTIVGVLDTNYYHEIDFNNFTLVQYGVQTAENNFLAIATNPGQNGNYRNTTTTNITHKCSRNMYSKDIVLDDPTVAWLQPPISTATDEIGFGVLLICAPCLLLCFMMAKGLNK
eukprot:847470_1